MWLVLLDPGIRRDDENGVNQSFLRLCYSNKVEKPFGFFQLLCREGGAD